MENQAMHSIRARGRFPQPSSLGFELPGDVFCQDIAFQVDLAPLFQGSQRGGLERVRDQSDAEMGVVRFDDRQADAIDRDGSFAGHVPHQVDRAREMKESPFSFILAENYGSDGVNVAGDEMPTQAISGTKGSFAIDLVADL